MLGGAARQVCVRFPNGEYADITSGIISGSASLEWTLCSATDLNFGECNASRFGVEISDIADITGLKIQAYVNVPGYENEIILFTGYVNSAKIQPERAARKIDAYDELYRHADDNVSAWYDGMFTKTVKAEYRGAWNAATRYIAEDTVSYGDAYYSYLCETSDQFSAVTGYDEDGNEITAIYNAADYCTGKTPEQLLTDEHGCNYVQRLDVYNPYNYGSVTVKKFRDSLFEYVGIQQEDVTLINDTVQITKTLDSTELRFSDCIKAICQINAVFGHISEAGVFQYVTMKDSAEDFSGNYKAANTTYEEFSTKPIDAVRLYGNTGDVVTVYGGGANCWNISNNFLLYALADDALAGIAKRLYDAVSDITYTPVSLTALLSMFPVALGNRITFTTHTGEMVASYILKETLSGAQLTEQIIVADGNESRNTALSTAETLGLIEAKTTAVVERIYEKITADNAEIKVISGDLANYKTVVAEKVQAAEAEIQNIRANNITTDNLEANVAALGYLSAETADLKYATISSLNAANAEIDTLKANSITTEYLNANFATIDLANIAAGTIKTAMIDTGAIQSAQIADGSITDAKIVELTANKITAGTLSIERLEVRGSTNSIVYELNNITGALQSQNVDTLNGEILTPRTITADKIVANSITGDEIAANTITANNIAANSITGDEIAANTIKAINIDVQNLFAQDITATGTIRGVSLVGATGSFAGSVATSNIIATGGTIGGFTITSNSLTVTNSKGNLVYLSNASNGNQDVLVVRTGSGTSASPYAYPVVIRGDGYAGFSNAHITGDITATSLTAHSAISMKSFTKVGKLFSTGESIDSEDEVFFNFDGVFTALHLNVPSVLASNVNISGELGCADIYSSGEVISTLGQYAQFRAVNGNYGFMIRNDGTNTYFLLTSSGDPYGMWNSDSSKFPLYINNSTGLVNMNAGLVGRLRHGSYSVMLRAGFSNTSATAFNPCNAAGTGAADGAIYLGGSGARWHTVYAVNGCKTSSDARDKEICGEVDDRYMQMFRKLRPVLYRWKNPGYGARVHVGLVAQEVEQAAGKYGIAYDELDALNHDYFAITDDGRTDRYSLSYEELSVFTMRAAQEALTRADVLEDSIGLQDNRIESLQFQLNNALAKISEQDAEIARLRGIIEAA